MGKAYQEIHREIIELSKAGNEKAQFELYSTYSKALFNLCMRIMNNRQDAEDALQDSFCAIFDKLHTYRYEASFGAWAKRLTINTCLNRLKKRKTHLVFSPDVHHQPESNDNDEDIEEIHLKVEKISKAITMLPDGYRLIFSLYLLEGFDHTEISEVLGITESTSKTQYMKAKKKIKEILRNEL